MSTDWLSRTRILIGDDGIDKISNSKVVVAGVGGVGAFAAEMLVRAGIGSVVLIDHDKFSITNLNRQIPSLNSNIGVDKCKVLKDRFLDINPLLKVDTIDKYIEESNLESLFFELNPNYIVDAIDTLAPKCALIKFAKDKGIPIVSSMGAGAKMDATKIRIKDISKTYNCPLAYALRKRLRKMGINSGIKAVFSEELPDDKAILAIEDGLERNKKSIAGTISYLPAVFGAVCAQVIIQDLLTNK